ncbi:MAG: flippase-like domain-containing protein [Candidatus Dormibacteraeota bacterium]|nr:flippase-like domain-containing protein [Candidatus Dormibacteraeota bacterium]
MLLAAGLGALALRQISPGDVEHALRHAGPGTIATAILGVVGFTFAKAWRYRTLLFPAPSTVPERPSLAAMMLVTLASWGPGLVLPTVTADGVFIWLGVTRLRRTVESCATAAMLARLLDLTSLLLVLLLSALLAGVRLPFGAQVAAVAGIVLLGGVVTAFLWARSRAGLLARLRRLPVVGRRIANVDEALDGVGRGRSVLRLAASTIAARVCTQVQYLALLAAVGLPLGFWDSWFALSARTLLLTIPIQGMFGLGTTQLWWASALALLGQPLHTAVVTGVSLHLLDLTVSLPLAAIGAVLLVLVTRARQA